MLKDGRKNIKYEVRNFYLPFTAESLIEALKSFFHGEMPGAKEGLFCRCGGFVYSVSETFIFQVTCLLINRSVSTAPFGDLFRNMKHRPAQHAISVFPAKGPLETKLCLLMSWKRVVSWTLNFACRFLYMCFTKS